MLEKKKKKKKTQAQAVKGSKLNYSMNAVNRRRQRNTSIYTQNGTEKKLNDLRRC